jgi:protein tyrosine kinase modulator
MMHQLDNLIEQLRGLWRFRWIGMVTAWAVLLLALIVITILPNRYQA